MATMQESSVQGGGVADSEVVEDEVAVDESYRVQTRGTLKPMYRSVDMQGRIIDCNDEYARMLEYGRDELIGMSIYDHAPEESHDVMRAIFENWKGNVPINNSKISLVTKSGRVFDVLITVDSIRDQTGRITRSNTSLLDYSGIKDMQERVKLSKYESLYENSPDMYRTVNIDGIIIDCNLAYGKRLGYTKPEIIGKPLAAHTAERSISGMLIHMAKWRMTGQAPTVETWLRKKNGAEFPVKLSHTNLYDEDGALIGRNVVLQDLTKLKEQESILETRKEIERLKDEFLSQMAHELKTPLTPIIGFGQALSRPGMLGDLNEKQTKAIKTILANATHMRQLVTDLLNVHKLELNKIKFNFAELDIQELIEGVVASTHHSVEEKDLVLTVNIIDGGRIISDEMKISEILNNFIYNAVDFTPNGGKISLEVEKQDEFYKFSVTDTGVGISPEMQGRLFTKFYQAIGSKKVTRKHGGSGLGLSICKGLAEGLGGTTGVNSEVGKGSTFYFTVRPMEEEQ